MILQIIDASVAIKWFVDDEDNRGAALCLLDQVKNHPRKFAVPELFLDEMVNVLSRLEPDEGKVHEYLDLLLGLGLQRLANGKDLLHHAVTLAKKYGLSGYDAIYAANAKLTGGKWVTADDKAHRKIHELHISQLLGMP